MQSRNIIILGAAILAGAIGGSMMGPHPAEAVSREIIDLQHDVTTLLQGQKDLATQMTQDHTVVKTLIEQSNDTVGKLNATMGAVQKSVQDVQANSGARLDTMSTQVQGLSDNLEEIKSRMGKLNQQLVDLQSTVQGLDAKISGNAPATAVAPTSTAPAPPPPANPGAAAALPPSPSNSLPAAIPSGGAPSADTLYSNGLRDITSGKYDLARQEFQDYLKYYGDTDLSSNAQFYLGEIAYAQKKYEVAVSEYDTVITRYPKSFKLAPAHLKKGMALIDLNQKPAGIRELRDVARRYPGTEEERRARAKLREMGVSVAATTSR